MSLRATVTFVRWYQAVEGVAEAHPLAALRAEKVESMVAELRRLTPAQAIDHRRVAPVVEARRRHLWRMTHPTTALCRSG